MVTLQDIIEEMRTIAMVAGQCSVEGPEGTLSDMAAAEAERAGRWADALTALTGADMVDTDDTCASTHTIRCTLARGHDGKHTTFRTGISWRDDVDATDRLRLMVLQIAASEWGQTACVPEHIRHALRGRCAWPFPEAWPSWTWAELHDALSLLSPLRPTPPETARLRDPVLELAKHFQDERDELGLTSLAVMARWILRESAVSPLRSTPQEHIVWRPIESAPKDGTWILTFRLVDPLPLGSMPAIVCWNHPFAEAHWSDGEYTFCPTHWQPLPAPPTTDESQILNARSTPQEGTTDDLTRIGELAVQPSPQHAAADREDS